MKFSEIFDRRTWITAGAIGVSCLFTGCGERSPRADSGSHGTNVLTLTQENFQSEVLSSTQPVLVDFWASWCGPCKMVAPAVAELGAEFEGRAKVGKVDVDAQTSLASKYTISAIPALLIFKNGREVERIIGLRSKAELKTALSKHVDANPPTAVAPK